jgi:thiosulfate/3-mercaptopyruvate sulfurtransferase
MHPLISVEDLAARVGDPDLRVIDCRWYLGRPGDGRAAYDAGHLPGAIHIDVDRDLAATEGPGRHPLPDPVAFAARLGALGVGNEHLVVAYDDVGGWVAARLWWMLDSLGHERVTVLDGGIGAWTAAGHGLTTDEPSWPPARLALAERWTGTIDRDVLRDRLGAVRLLDARGGPRYRGETEPIDATPGHIPTAVHAPTDDNLAADGRFLAADALAARFTALGADGGAAEVVTSCGSGVSACHNALAMRAAGLPDPILYVGSYSDWTRSGYPVATGPEPGAVPQATVAVRPASQRP